MSLALISLSKDAPEDSGPIGLLSLFDGNILDQQVRAAIEAGAEQILLVCHTMDGAFLQYVDHLRSSGIDAQLVRSGKDLVQFAAPESDILFFGDGMLPGKTMVEQLADMQGEAIFVVNDAEEYSDLERIDLNHRWLGVARLTASRLSEFIDLPEDWDVGSALLRGAVQSECKREVVTDSEISEGAVSHLMSKSIISDYTQEKLADARFKNGNFLERFVVWPLSRALLPRLWQNPGAGNYLGWSVIMLLLFAGGVSLFNVSTVVVFILMLLAAGLLAIRGYIDLFSSNIRHLDWFLILSQLLIGIIILMMVVRDSTVVTMPPNLVIYALLLGVLVLVRQTSQISHWDWIKPETMLVLMTMLVFVSIGSFFAGLYFTAIWGMIFLLGKFLTAPGNE